MGRVRPRVKRIARSVEPFNRSYIDYLRSILSDTNGSIRQLTKQENDVLKAQYLGEVYGILGTGINPEIGALYQNLLYNYSMRNYLNY